MEFFDILTQYGVLGVWVVYAITRERWLLRKIEEISERSTRERETWHKEREQFLKQCHLERENFIKEIALVRSEERNFYIKELEKLYKKIK
jgi:tRNA-dihydrouridine synthase